MESYFCHWRKLPLSSDIGRRCSHSASKVGDKIWIIGGGWVPPTSSAGVAPPLTFTQYSDVHTIDPRTGDCQKVELGGDEFVERRGHSACVFLNRYIVLFGGIESNTLDDTGDKLSSDLFVLDTQLRTFKRYSRPVVPIEASPVVWPYRRRGHCAVIYKDKLYIFGGQTGLGAPGSISAVQGWLDSLSSLFSLDLADLFLSRAEGEGDGQGSWVWQRRVLPSLLELLRRIISQQGRFTELSLMSSTLQGSRWLFVGGSVGQQQSPKASAFVLDLETFVFGHLPITGAAGIEARRAGGVHRADLVADLPDTRFCAAGLCDLSGALVLFGGSDPSPGRPQQAYSDLFALFRGDATNTTTAAASTAATAATAASASATCAVEAAAVAVAAASTATAAVTGGLADGSWCGLQSRSLKPLPREFCVLTQQQQQQQQLGAPSARNAATLTCCGPATALLFGGGVPGAEYFSDCWILTLVKVPPARAPLPQLANPEGEGRIMDFFRSLFLPDHHPGHPWADVVFELDDGRDLPAHRVVLSARSNYFRTLLSGSFSEACAPSTSVQETTGQQTLRCRLHGVSRAGLLEIFTFLYTDEWSASAFETVESTCSLALVADQLQEARTLEACLNELERSALRQALGTYVADSEAKAASVTSLIQMLGFAEHLSATRLMEQIVQALHLHLLAYPHFPLPPAGRTGEEQDVAGAGAGAGAEDEVCRWVSAEMFDVIHSARLQNLVLDLFRSPLAAPEIPLIY